MKMKRVWWGEDATLGITDGGLGCGQRKLQDVRALPRVLQGKARLCPHRDAMMLSGLLCPSGARVGDHPCVRATGCWKGAGMPQRAPGQPQSAAPLPGTLQFPSQLGQFLPPAVEQVLRRAVLHHYAQSRAATHHSWCHSILFPSLPYSPTTAPLATGACLGRAKGRDVSTSQPEGDHCT